MMKVSSPIFLFVLFIVSCNSDFNDISQAKNEVNPQGYRNGKWVDFFDSSSNPLTDTTSGYSSYRLTTFENGIPVLSKAFDSKGTLISEDKPIQPYTKLHEKSFIPILLQESLIYTSNPNETIKETYDTTGNKTQINWLSNNTPSAVCRLSYQNHQGGAYKAINFEFFPNKKDTNKHNFTFLNFSLWNQLHWSSRVKLKKKVNQAIAQNIDTTSGEFKKLFYVLEPLIKSKAFPYTIQRFNLNKIEIPVQEIANNFQKEYKINQLRIARANRIKQNRRYNSRSSYNSGSYRRSGSTKSYSPLKKCRWCSRSFRGSHYEHLGKLVSCHTSSKKYPVTSTYCSLRCCSQARRQGIINSRRY